MAEKEISTSGVDPIQEEATNSEPKMQNIFSAKEADLTKRLADKSGSELLDELLTLSESDLLPWEDMILPSRGVYYKDLMPGGLVRVKPMGAHADKILATQRLAQTGQSIDYLFEHCVQLPNGITAPELLAGDRTYLLYVLRGITHGNIYEFMLTCPHCEATNSMSYDLNELAMTITTPDPAIGDEPFKVNLPYMSRITGKDVYVRIRFLRGTDISKMAQRQRFKKKVAPATTKGPKNAKVNKGVVIDETLTENLNLIVVNFMDEVSDPVKIKSLVDRLHSSDIAEIREFLKDHSPGIDTTISVTCPDCGAQFKTELPITESFFRPTQR